MPPKAEPITELGAVNGSAQTFRAEAEYCSNTGERVHVYGPRRDSRHRAETALDDIRAAGAVGKP